MDIELIKNQVYYLHNKYQYMSIDCSIDYTERDNNYCTGNYVMMSYREPIIYFNFDIYTRIDLLLRYKIKSVKFEKAYEIAEDLAQQFENRFIIDSLIRSKCSTILSDIKVASELGMNI